MHNPNEALGSNIPGILLLGCLYLYRYFSQKWDRQGFLSEILFEKEFVSYLPWRRAVHPASIFNQPIATLCHVTHRTEAERISALASSETDKSGEYVFFPQPKKGKCGYYITDGSPLGESYLCNLKGSIPNENTVYKAVSPDQHLLPKGSYSWWGVDEPGKESKYGSCKFSVSFGDLLRAFQKSHSKFGQKPSLSFRKAGTLRYRYEICYVIVVHASTDDDRYIRHLPPLTNREEKFEFHDFLNDQGVVTNWQANDPIFRLAQHDENVAFGFYFSPTKGPLRIPQDDVTPDEVDHPRKPCIRKLKECGSWQCPDDV